jgi:hypothetical protein
MPFDFFGGLERCGQSNKLEDYKFVGGDRDEYDDYFKQCGFEETERPSQTHCVCGHFLKIRYYVLNIVNGRICVIGKDCLQKFMPAQFEIKCKSRKCVGDISSEGYCRHCCGQRIIEQIKTMFLDGERLETILKQILQLESDIQKGIIIVDIEELNYLKHQEKLTKQRLYQERQRAIEQEILARELEQELLSKELEQQRLVRAQLKQEQQNALDKQMEQEQQRSLEKQLDQEKKRHVIPTIYPFIKDLGEVSCTTGDVIGLHKSDPVSAVLIDWCETNNILSGGHPHSPHKDTGVMGVSPSQNLGWFSSIYWFDQ